MSKAQQAKPQAQEVIKKAEAQVPTKINLEEMAGQGMEFVTARDQKLPILKILYANSPVLDESDGKYIERAKQGDIYSETSGNLWKGKDGVYVVPCLFINTFNEWKDKGDSPGRPVKIHSDPSILNSTHRGDDNKDRLENGNYIEDTGNHFVYILDKDFQPVEQALIAMKSTQKKKSKTWNSMMQLRRKPKKNGSGSFNPPCWSHVYKLSTTKESNSQNSWYGWVIDFVKFLDEGKDLSLLQTTSNFYKSARESDIFGKVDFSQEMKKVSGKDNAETPF
tara:strand:- start:2800 stop:3636 length:837 start_codon:yes stop_codon:yes gene_type:complete